ncbi:MAG: metal ABC transporter solute-binding protein, Zn/Mn family [Bacteroidales bacterium]
MMFKSKIKLVLIASLMFFFSCGRDSNQSSSEKKVISVSIYPQKYFIEQIAGEDVRVNVIIPPGANPATYEPSPGQMKNLGDSEAYLKIGHLVFEKAWLPKLSSVNPDMKIFDQSENIDVISDKGHSHGNHQHSAGIDPHIWMSPKLVKKQIKTVRDMLQKLYPDNENVFNENYSDFLRELDTLDTYMENRFDSADNRAFIIFHPALSYLAKDYNLTQISIETEGKEPTPSKMEELMQKAENNQINTIFIQEQFSTDKAKALAREINAKVVVINPLSYDWYSEMRTITDKLVKSMTKD